jgi:hypothetical protein
MKARMWICLIQTTCVHQIPEYTTTTVNSHQLYRMVNALMDAVNSLATIQRRLEDRRCLPGTGEILSLQLARKAAGVLCRGLDEREVNESFAFIARAL